MRADLSGQPSRQSRAGFGNVVHAEWTKFRTMRRRVIGIVVAAALLVLFTFLTASGNHTSGNPPVASGPGGEAVAASYYLVGRSLTGAGTLTARLTSLSGRISSPPANAPSGSQAAGVLANSRPGLDAWSKAGIIVTSSATQGAPYAAVMATGGHGVRFQYDYTHDTAGPPDRVAAGVPRWLRLVRSGDTLTAYDSTDGQRWTRVGGATLAGLPATVRIGLFVTSPATFAGLPTLATATFDQVTLDPSASAGAWHGQGIGGGGGYPTLAPGGSSRSGDSFVVSGSGDIAPLVPQDLAAGTASSSLPLGLSGALIALTVVATVFITAEYRRGLIRTSFTAVPARGSVLAAKAVVVGAVAFAVGALAAGIAIPVGVHVLRANGNYVFAVGGLAELRIVLGSGAVVALGAIGVLGLATILRNAAGAITVGVVVFVLPFILMSGRPGAVDEWLYRVTPLAGFAVLQAFPRYAQVSFPYTVANGYYPLAPWAGVAVLCAWAALALAGARFVLARRDA